MQFGDDVITPHVNGTLIVDLQQSVSLGETAILHTLDHTQLTDTTTSYHTLGSQMYGLQSKVYSGTSV